MKILLSAAAAAALAAVSPLSSSWKDIGGGLPAGFEPSDIVWQTRTQRLLVVSDGGTIAEMDADGGSVRTWVLPGDLEGIAVADPASDRVYVADERARTIVEFDLKAGRVVRRIAVPGLETLEKKNKGPEALTFVPDSRQPEGGLFWLGIQGDGSVRVLSLPPAAETAAPAREVRRFTPRPGHKDLSGLDWDRESGRIWAVYDKDDLVVVLSPDGRVEASWPIAGEHQEGIALAPGRLFIADDSGPHVLRFDRGKVNE